MSNESIVHIDSYTTTFISKGVPFVRLGFGISNNAMEFAVVLPAEFAKVFAKQVDNAADKIIIQLEVEKKLGNKEEKKDA